MKLYYKPGACSLASHIVLRETGTDFDLEKVDTAAGTTETGAKYTDVNPKGYVPALALDDGAVLTEGAAILQFIADGKSEISLAPAPGTLDRVRLQEHLNYIASELHKAFNPFFAAEAPTGAAKEAAEEKLASSFAHVETALGDGRDYLLGDSFSVADAYLFVVANWANFTGIGLDRWPHVAAFVNRVAARPSAQAAMRAEGLIQ